MVRSRRSTCGPAFIVMQPARILIRRFHRGDYCTGSSGRKRPVERDHCLARILNSIREGFISSLCWPDCRWRQSLCLDNEPICRWCRCRLPKAEQRPVLSASPCRRSLTNRTRTCRILSVRPGWQVLHGVDAIDRGRDQRGPHRAMPWVRAPSHRRALQGHDRSCRSG